MYLVITGQLREALDERQRALSLDTDGGAVDPWPRALDVACAYCHTYLGEFAAARRLVDTVASAALSPTPVTDILCPGLNGQIAYGEGALTQADASRLVRWTRFAGSALTTTISPSRAYAPRPSLPWSDAIWTPPPAWSNRSWNWSAVAAPPSSTSPTWTEPGSGPQPATSREPWTHCRRREPR